MNKHNIIVLPQLATFTDRALAAIRNGQAVTICGEEGCGATTACLLICSRWAAEESGKFVQIRTFRETDHLKLTQHLALQVLGDEMPVDLRVHCASTLWHLVSKKVQKGGSGLIFLDRTDLAPEGFVDSLLSMAADCALAGAKIGVLMGMRHVGRQLPLFEDESSSCISYTARIIPLSGPNILAVMQQLGAAVSDLCEGVSRNDAASYQAMTALEKLSEGAFRRVVQFANFLVTEGKKAPTSASAMESVWKMAFYG